MKYLQYFIAVLALFYFMDAQAKIDGSSGLTYLSTHGNINTQSFGTDNKISHQGELWDSHLKYNYTTFKSRNKTLGQEVLLEIENSRIIYKQFLMTNKITHFENKFKGILKKESFEIGPSFDLYKKDDAHLRIGGLYSFMSEELEMRGKNNFNAFEFNLFASKEISKTAKVEVDISHIINLELGSDWRTQHLISLTSQVTSFFALKLSHQLTRRNIAPIGYTNTDSTMTTSIVANY